MKKCLTENSTRDRIKTKNRTKQAAAGKGSCLRGVLVCEQRVSGWGFVQIAENEEQSMKSLLILGAGGHGRVVAETAEACGYEKISFLDDHSENAIGKIGELQRFVKDYEFAFVGIGNNRLRGELQKCLEKAGYKVPTLIHPTAYISKTAEIGSGTIVEPKAIVNAGTVVGTGCIISVGAIVDHDVVLGTNVHVNAGAIVKAGAAVESCRKLEAGEVVFGYGSK